MKNPLVSVIIPIYNTAPYLGYCLNSLISQSYTNWQGILIDDGSTDGSRDIAHRYAQLDARFTLHSVPNGGVSKARNLGLQYASGKYLHFLDSDDVLAAETLERLVDAAETYKIELVISDVLITDFSAPDRKGPRLSAKHLQKSPAILSAAEFKEQRMRLIWHTALLEGLYGKLYNRSLWERLHLRFPEDISLGEDFVTNLRYYAACNGAVFLNQIGHYYNNIEGSDSLTHRYRPDLFEAKMRLMELLWIHLHTDHTPGEEERICFHNYAAGTGLLCIDEVLRTNALTKREKQKRLKVLCTHPLFSDSLTKAEYIPSAFEEYVPLILLGHVKALLRLSAAKKLQTTAVNRAIRYGLRKLSPNPTGKAAAKLSALEQSLAEHGIRHTLISYKEKHSPSNLPPMATFLLTPLLLLLALTQLELSCGRTEAISMPYLLLNLATLLSLHCFFQLFCGRLSNTVFMLLSTSVSLVNYYVIRFKGSPLSFLELRNLGTAVNVIDGYHLPFTRITAAILCLGLIGLACSRFCRNHRKTSEFPWLLRKASLLLTILLTLEIGYCSADALKPQHAVGWLWREAYHQYGYAPCTVESFFSLFHAVTVPDGYDAAAMEAIDIPPSKTTLRQTPDIILILNESFYDLSLITDLHADQNYLSLLNREDICTGTAVVPAYGGGTNSSEYELLTSNSMALLPGVTPFNILDLTDANSIVSHLNALGYDTLGCHSESGENYYRNSSYPALGFRQMYFDEDFLNKTYHHNRYYESDESLYKNLNRWYDEMSEGPRFLYLLTIQNHGSWDHNPPEADTVHAQSEYGEYDDDVDEYLTAVSQSDDAFQQLIEHYAEVDRPVIICMLGDHCPNFAKEMIDSKYTAAEAELLYRSTPLLIWANYELGVNIRDLGTMSLNFVVPTLLELAGVPLSPYYQTMLELKEQLPVLTSYGVCYDPDGTPYQWDETFPYGEAVRRYFHWEYNNLSDQRRQALFAPYQ